MALPASAAAPRLGLPYDVERDPAGRIVIADGGRHQLLRWAAARKRLVVLKTGIGEPTSLVFDGRGNAYVSDVDGGVVRRIDPRGRMSTVLRLERAAGVSVDPSGRYLAVASFTRGVVRVALATGSVETIARLTTPHGVAYGANVDLWIADTAAGVYRLRPGGQPELVSRVRAFRVVPLAGGAAYLVSGGPTGGASRPPVGGRKADAHRRHRPADAARRRHPGHACRNPPGGRRPATRRPAAADADRARPRAEGDRPRPDDQDDRALSAAAPSRAPRATRTVPVTASSARRTRERRSHIRARATAAA